MRAWQIRLSNRNERIGYIAIEEVFRLTRLELEFGGVMTPIVARSHPCQRILKERLLHQERSTLLDDGTDSILHHVLQRFGVGFAQIALDLLQVASRLLQRRNEQVIADLQRRIELVAVLRLCNRHQKPDILVMAQRLFRSAAKVSEFTRFERSSGITASLFIGASLAGKIGAGPECVQVQFRKCLLTRSGLVPCAPFNLCSESFS